MGSPQKSSSSSGSQSRIPPVMPAVLLTILHMRRHVDGKLAGVAATDIEHVAARQLVTVSITLRTRRFQRSGPFLSRAAWPMY